MCVPDLPAVVRAAGREHPRDLPKLRTLVRLDDADADADADTGADTGADTDTDTDAGAETARETAPTGAVPFAAWLDGTDAEPWDAERWEAEPWEAAPPDDIVMIAGTGGTTGKPKGVMLSGRNIETMSALTLMSYPFGPRPVYLALAPLTHAAGVLCFPVLSLGGEIVVMPRPDLGEFLALVEHHGVTHTFLPPTLVYALLAHPELNAATRPRSAASGTAPPPWRPPGWRRRSDASARSSDNSSGRRKRR